jgi:hypothetical protein
MLRSESKCSIILHPLALCESAPLILETLRKTQRNLRLRLRQRETEHITGHTTAGVDNVQHSDWHPQA